MSGDQEPGTADPIGGGEGEAPLDDELAGGFARSTVEVPRPSKPMVVALVLMAAAIVWFAATLPGAERLERDVSATGAPQATRAEEGAGAEPEDARPARLPAAPVVLELSAECSEAVAPVRALVASTPSGLSLAGEAAEQFSAGLAEAQQRCSPEEYEKFVSGELDGWLLTPPGGSGGD